jgi:hypothetical protein
MQTFAEVATLDNFVQVIDGLNGYEGMILVSETVEALKEAHCDLFDITHLVNKAHRWGEIWVPALNRELYPNPENPRTTWDWYCTDHLAYHMPISVLELTCNAENCEPTNWQDKSAKFPFLAEAE